MQKISIKREQSQAGLSFAERENRRSTAGGKAKFRPQVKNKLLLLLALLTMLSTRAVAQNDASAMRELMKTRIDELKALAPDNVKGLNETLKHDTVKVYIARYTDWYNASPLKSYQDYEDAYDHLGWIIDRVNNYLNAYMEFTDNMAKLKTLIQNFNADTENKQGYKTFAQNVYDAYKALSEHDMIALTDDNVEDQKGYDDDNYWVEPDDVTSDNIESVADAAGNHEYISTYGQFNAFFSQNTKELGSIYLEVAGTGTAESPENLTAQLKNPDFENADEQWWGTDWTAFGNNLAEHRGNNTFDTYQMVHLPQGYYTLVGYGMDRRGSWEDVLANHRDWRRYYRTDLYAITDYDGNDTLRVEAFRAKDMALTADITEGAGNISTCEVDGITYYTPNDMAQYRAWENAKIAMTGNGHGALVQFEVWQDEGDFAKLGFVHRWPIDNTWFVADGIQLYYATDNFPDININTPIPAATTYTVSLKDGVKDADKWTVKVGDGQAQALPIGGLKGDGSETVTLQYNGRLKVKGVKATIEAAPAEALPALCITSPSVGQVIGSDGKNYAAASVPSGVTKVAMIAYVSGSNGLAIALADEGSLNWETAKSRCEAKTPAFTGGTWKLPSQAEWNQMFKANGGNEGSYSGLNSAITTAGGTVLPENGDYWSSTPNDGSYAWDVFLSGGAAYWYGDTYVSDDVRVRACLAFTVEQAAKEPATVTTAPTGAAIVGVGKTTALVSGGVADGGTLWYAVTTTNTKPASTDGFSDAVPTAKDITASGKVYVWYYVKGDDTHSDSEIAATAIEVPVADIVWDITNVSDLYVEETYASYTKEGVTLSANAENIFAGWNDNGDPKTDGICFQVYGLGGFTFTAPAGKEFTKIEMNALGYNGWNEANLGIGWAYSEDETNNIYKVTWTGSAASADKLLPLTDDFVGENVISIGFYLVDAE